MSAQPDVLEAIESFACELHGVPMAVNAGETVTADDERVALRPFAFVPVGTPTAERKRQLADAHRRVEPEPRFTRPQKVRVLDGTVIHAGVKYLRGDTFKADPAGAEQLLDLRIVELA